MSSSQVCLLVSPGTDIGTIGGSSDSDDNNAEGPLYARGVCQALSERFGVENVAVRSSRAPGDRLIAVPSTEPKDLPSTADGKSFPTLYVLLGSSSAATMATKSILEAEGEDPVLVVDRSESPESAALAIAKFCSLSSPQVHAKVKREVAARRQARMTEDAQMRTSSFRYTAAIAACYDANRTVTGDGVSLPGRVRGKVRDRYFAPEAAGAAPPPEELSKANLLAIVTTDRQSGFDRMLAQVPYKGAVLNLTSAFWFRQTERIVPNHLVSVPHPNVSLVRRCEPFPIEFVVRAYMTGSTSTSIWKNYQDGVRTYCGHPLPDGMVKNQKLAETLLTPTTKEEHHDRPVSLEEIVREGWMDPADLQACADAALRVFALGQEVAGKHGLILVDTKYEFGKDGAGTIRLIDEVHTPDSSRYWLASTYEQRLREGKEPDNIDKEFLRLWFRDHCDPYKDEVLPEAPRDLVLELSRRYITLYEMITGRDFDFSVPGEEEIAKAIQSSR